MMESILARTDMKQDSAVKSLGANVLKSINFLMEKGVYAKRRTLQVRKHLTALEYILNDQPNREEMFGSDFDWKLNTSEDSYARLTQGNNEKRFKRLVESLKTMGYEDISHPDSKLNVRHHIKLGENNTHILIDPAPVMADGETYRSGPALSLKSLKASEGDSANLVVFDDYFKLKPEYQVVDLLVEQGCANLNATASESSSQPDVVSDE